MSFGLPFLAAIGVFLAILWLRDGAAHKREDEKTNGERLLDRLF